MSCGLLFSCCRTGVDQPDRDLNSSFSAASGDEYFVDEENVISLRLRSSETLSKDSMDLVSDDDHPDRDSVARSHNKKTPCLQLFGFSSAAAATTSEVTAKHRAKVVRKYTPETINGIVRAIRKLQDERDHHHLFRYPLGEDIKYISPFFLCRYQSCMVALNNVCLQLERWLGYYRLEKELKELEVIHCNIAGDCYELSTPLSIAVNKIRPHIFAVVKHYHPKQGAIVNALMVACVSALDEVLKQMASLDQLFHEPRSWILSKRSHSD